jgi:tRNA pseudouridine13 synthase
MAGKPEPDWQALAVGGDVQVLAVGRHLRKLKRGVHRANRFTLVLRDLGGDCSAMEQRLQQIRQEGFPNYFGEQRFGRDGGTLQQARRWMASGGRRISRHKRSLFLSALRAHLFNTLLAQRVESGEWHRILPGDVCILQGSRSLFTCDEVNEDIIRRAVCGDIHPGLPLWGKGESGAGDERLRQQAEVLADEGEVCDFLEQAGLDLAWRPARTLADDFSWKFCDDGSLQLDFALGAGSYATALLAEFVQYKENREW